MRREPTTVMRASLKTLTELLHSCAQQSGDIVTRQQLLSKYRTLSKSKSKVKIVPAYPTPIRLKRSLDYAFNDYLYTATSLGLLDTLIGGKVYKISNMFKEIDSKLHSEDPADRSSGLRELAILAANQFPAFARFWSLLKEKQLTREDLLGLRGAHSKRIFNPQTLNMLIEWGNFTQTIGILRPSNVLYAKPTVPREHSNEEFWAELSRAYERLSRTRMIGRDRYFVKVTDLRSIVGRKLLMEIDEFDLYLERLLRDDKYRAKIALAPGHPAYLAIERGKPAGVLRGFGKAFKYNKRNYYFLRIK
jgi:hypothetical protein